MCRLGEDSWELYGEFNLEPKNGVCVKSVPKCHGLKGYK